MTERPSRRSAHPAPRRDFGERDPLGRMALFSDVESAPAPEHHWFLECSSCLKETRASVRALVRAGLPLSVHVPLVKRYPSLLRCPACGRRTWMRLVRR